MILMNPETIQTIQFSTSSVFHIVVKTQNGFFEFPAAFFFELSNNRINMETLNKFVEYLDTTDIYYKDTFAPFYFYHEGRIHWNTWSVDSEIYGKFAKEFELNKPYCIVRFLK